MMPMARRTAGRQLKDEQRQADKGVEGETAPNGANKADTERRLLAIVGRGVFAGARPRLGMQNDNAVARRKGVNGHGMKESVYTRC